MSNLFFLLAFILVVVAPWISVAKLTSDIAFDTMSYKSLHFWSKLAFAEMALGVVLAIIGASVA